MKIFKTTALALSMAAILVFQSAAICKAQAITDAPLARTMEGHYLHDMLGDILGKIQTVTFDRAGAPTYIVISVTGDRIKLVPFSALVGTSMANGFVANISERQLRRLPAYSIDALNLLPR